MIIELTDSALRTLQQEMATRNLYAIHVKTRPDGVEIKANEGVWTPTVGSIIPDPTEPLPVINRTPVLASSFDQERGGYVVLMPIAYPTRTEYVVARVQTLNDPEWTDGKYHETYEKAVQDFTKRMLASPPTA
jgi:hypothetical protein